jgi:hypothetical protein
VPLDDSVQPGPGDGKNASGLPLVTTGLLENPLYVGCLRLGQGLGESHSLSLAFSLRLRSTQRQVLHPDDRTSSVYNSPG